MTLLVERAAAFAIAAHSAVGQIRKYTGEPYYNHCMMVAELVRSHGGTIDMIAAAWLHDVLEDTKSTVTDMVSAGIPLNVIDMVVWLTKVEVPGNRAARKAAELTRLTRAPAEVQTIKCADLLHNLSSIVDFDKDFAPIFIKEAKALHRVFTLADRELSRKLEMRLDRAAFQLEIAA